PPASNVTGAVVGLGAATVSVAVSVFFSEHAETANDAIKSTTKKFAVRSMPALYPGNVAAR
ncbi:MAG TPA: hypothetical protein VJ719_10255, partial [Chthoniobacterales bacterium]|nr:hypothetical protein [Chthoniobacterales bacterium]